MEKSLVADPKTNVIIFWDKAKVFLTEFENIQIESRMEQGADGFKLDNNKYKFNDIAKWITLKEYYKLYPGEIIAEYKKIETTLIPYSARRHLRGLKAMRKGFVEHWKGRDMNYLAKKIYRNIEKSISGVKQDGGPGKMFYGNN